MRLFNIRNLSVASLLAFGLGVPLFGANQFVQYTQVILGFPPSTAAAANSSSRRRNRFVAPVIVLLVLADKINLKVPITIGFILVPVSYAMLALAGSLGLGSVDVCASHVLSGDGFACLFTPIANLLIQSLRRRQYVRKGIAIFKLVLLLGGSIATTVLGVIYDHSLAGFTSLLTGEPP